jgi:hypothetical protein
MRQPEHSPAARVAAACALLDRGWGRPLQADASENGEGPFTVVIRNVTAELAREQRPLQIEAVPNATDNTNGEPRAYKRAP